MWPGLLLSEGKMFWTSGDDLPGTMAYQFGAVVTDARGGSSGGGSSAASSEDEGEDEEKGSGDGMAETLRRAPTHPAHYHLVIYITFS